MMVLYLDVHGGGIDNGIIINIKFFGALHGLLSLAAVDDDGDDCLIIKERMRTEKRVGFDDC